MIFPSIVTVVSSPSMDCLDFWERDTRFSALLSFSLSRPSSAPVVAILTIERVCKGVSQGEEDAKLYSMRRKGNAVEGQKSWTREDVE